MEDFRSKRSACFGYCTETSPDDPKDLEAFRESFGVFFKDPRTIFKRQQSRVKNTTQGPRTERKTFSQLSPAKLSLKSNRLDSTYVVGKSPKKPISSKPNAKSIKHIKAQIENKNKTHVSKLYKNTQNSWFRPESSPQTLESFFTKQQSKISRKNTFDQSFYQTLETFSNNVGKLEEEGKEEIVYLPVKKITTPRLGVKYFINKDPSMFRFHSNAQYEDYCEQIDMRKSILKGQTKNVKIQKVHFDDETFEYSNSESSARKNDLKSGVTTVKNKASYAKLAFSPNNTRDYARKGNEMPTNDSVATKIQYFHEEHENCFPQRQNESPYLMFKPTLSKRGNNGEDGQSARLLTGSNGFQESRDLDYDLQQSFGSPIPSYVSVHSKKRAERSMNEGQISRDECCRRVNSQGDNFDTIINEVEKQNSNPIEKRHSTNNRSVFTEHISNLGEKTTVVSKGFPGQQQRSVIQSVALFRMKKDQSNAMFPNGFSQAMPAMSTPNDSFVINSSAHERIASPRNTNYLLPYQSPRTFKKKQAFFEEEQKQNSNNYHQNQQSFPKEYPIKPQNVSIDTLLKGCSKSPRGTTDLRAANLSCEPMDKCEKS